MNEKTVAALAKAYAAAWAKADAAMEAAWAAAWAGYRKAWAEAMVAELGIQSERERIAGGIEKYATTYKEMSWKRTTLFVMAERIRKGKL